MSSTKSLVAAGVALATLASATLTTTTPAAARGWGAPFAGGLIGGLAAGAIIGSATRPAYGYGYGSGYGYGYAPAPAYGYAPEPVYNPCYRSRTPVYDAYGEFAGYRSVRVCN